MNNNSRKVPIWLIVVLLVSIFTAIIGWIFVSINKLDGKVEASVNSLNDYKKDANLLNSQILEQLAGMKKDIQWIIKALETKNK